MKLGFPETVIMPGHITGPGWNFINPCGNLDPKVFERIAHGDVIYLPDFGMGVLHNVHADDVAQVFMNAILYRNRALGESFHATAPTAMSRDHVGILIACHLLSQLFSDPVCFLRRDLSGLESLTDVVA